RMNSCIRKETSSLGRRQFSELKANSVRWVTPRSMHARITALTDSTPRRCPAMRGRKRLRAQRPLPSMMTAMWAGTSPTSGTARVELVNVAFTIGEPPGVLRLKTPRPGGSNLHQLVFFLGEQLVDFGDILVGELLHRFLPAALVVLGDFLVLDGVLEVLVSVTAKVADCDLGRLALVAHDLDQFLAALLGERGHRHTDQVALGGRVESQIAVADGLL